MFFLRNYFGARCFYAKAPRVPVSDAVLFTEIYLAYFATGLIAKMIS